MIYKNYIKDRMPPPGIGLLSTGHLIYRDHFPDWCQQMAVTGSCNDLNLKNNYLYLAL